MYDAIIVGARCAGSPTGMLLARKGYKVLVVDKATFPSDTLSTHFVTSEGVKFLSDWGLLERVLETNCPPILQMKVVWGGIEMPSLIDPAYPGICPRRTVFDKVLVDAAREAGAEVREAFTLDELIIEDGVVVGVRGHNRGGEAVEERAKVVIGADGKYSRVAEAVQAPQYNAVPSATCGWYSYWSGFEGAVGTEVYVQDGHGIFVFKTNDGLTCSGVEFPKAEFEQLRGDVEGSMMAAFDTIPGLGERARKATRVDKYYGSAGEDSYYRKPYGPGWALAGDSGYMKDPIMGQGMTDAFRDAAMLSEALDAGWSGRKPLDEALAAYEQQRNEATAMIYYITNLVTAELKPDPNVIAQIRMGMTAMIEQQQAAAASAG